MQSEFTFDSWFGTRDSMVDNWESQTSSIHPNELCDLSYLLLVENPLFPLIILMTAIENAHAETQNCVHKFYNELWEIAYPRQCGEENDENILHIL